MDPNLDNEVIAAFLKLARAMRRCPPEKREMPFSPAIGRLLECAAANPGVSSRELCELLDLRPSSLSEMLARAEAEGLLTRTVDENDRRVQRVTLAERGERLIREMENARSLDARKKTACLSEAEKQQFVELCGRLSAHMERLALDLPEDRLPPEGMRPPKPIPDGPRLPRRPFPPEGRLKS